MITCTSRPFKNGSCCLRKWLFLSDWCSKYLFYDMISIGHKVYVSSFFFFTSAYKVFLVMLRRSSSSRGLEWIIKKSVGNTKNEIWHGVILWQNQKLFKYFVYVWFCNNNRRISLYDVVPCTQRAHMVPYCPLCLATCSPLLAIHSGPFSEYLMVTTMALEHLALA